ncbi:hypothetical protein V6N12_028850 [Hibiscus sabdariffa]|uniref:Uncharacterized protein n=1 Tax=Hibiscus sabdariffa TaxID=183260 RepID=A0ABR2F729_9ROSI
MHCSGQCYSKDIVWNWRLGGHYQIAPCWDKLTSTTENILEEDLISLGNGDIHLLEDDVPAGKADKIPFINFYD